jgi:hypothetical protein
MPAQAQVYPKPGDACYAGSSPSDACSVGSSQERRHPSPSLGDATLCRLKYADSSDPAVLKTRAEPVPARYQS